MIREDLGTRGEIAAAHHLEAAGLRVVCRGFRCRAGEIDLIARDGAEVVFVEVKSRVAGDEVRPAEAVTPRKQAKLATVALVYLQRKGLLDAIARFDVIEALEQADGGLRIHHIEDAFRPVGRGF